MKTAIFILIILASSSIYACNNSQSYECNSIQIERIELTGTDSESDNCCSEYCFCNCCNQISVLSYSMMQKISYKLTSTIVVSYFQNLSDYSPSHWQPPKVIRI